MSEAPEHPMPLFELRCLGCRTPTEVVVDFGGPPRGTQFAVTCDHCGRVHWVTFAVGEADPVTGVTNVVARLDEDETAVSGE